MTYAPGTGHAGEQRANAAAEPSDAGFDIGLDIGSGIGSDIGNDIYADPAVRDPLSELSYCLWRQRQLLELLVFKLESQQLLLAAGKSRWLTVAADEVEAVLAEIRRGELVRALHTDAVAFQLGLDAEPSLMQIIERVHTPWTEILCEHREAFLAMTAQVEGLTLHNRELLNRGYQATRDFITSISGLEPDGYSAGGASTSFRIPHHTVDRAV